MTDREPVETRNLDGYGFPPLAWSRPHDRLEGEAARVTDQSLLERVVKLFNEGGWPATVDAEAAAFTAPTRWRF